MGLLLLIIAAGGLGLAVILVTISLYFGKFKVANYAIAGGTFWILAYSALLLGTSFLSTEKDLALNQPKQFCGFYLDCHMHASVLGVRKEKTFGRMIAKNEFYIVTVKIFSDAKRAKLGLITPKFTVIDASGKTYPQTEDMTISQNTFEKRIDPGTSIEGEIAFDLPSDIQDPRLDIREGYGIDHAIEAVLIGDEDSIFHKRSYFKIGEEYLTSTRSNK